MQPSTATQLTFSGRPGVLVAPGSRVLSDPMIFPTTSSSRVAVTVTVTAGEEPTSPNAVDMGACTGSRLSAAEAETAPGAMFNAPHRLAWLRSLLVYGAPRRTVAAFGDSISVSPQVPLHNYWSDVLLGHDATIVNAGAGGSYLTTMGMYGTAVGLRRLDDLLAEPGLSDVVVLIGSNDLAVGVSPGQLLNALETALQHAAARHVRLWVCTILPRQTAGWTEASEQARLVLNAVLRSAWLPDHGGQLIDTDAALRDPAQPWQLRIAYDSGDHVHPSLAGAQRLGITIGLAIGLLL